MRGENLAVGTAGSTLRIIGGKWRSRRVGFAAHTGVRPTPDRVRETLFNWLRPRIEGARCLDLFAGSGALGFEAASRGAGDVVMVDAAAPVVETLQRQAAILSADAIRVVRADAMAFVHGAAPCAFDIVFLDPPFGLDPIDSLCDKLERNGWLEPDAWVYLERERSAPSPSLPPGWGVARSKTAGQVRYCLVLRG